MCLDCYNTLDELFVNHNPVKMKHHVFLMFSDGVDPTRQVEVAEVPCRMKLSPIVTFVRGLDNVEIDGCGISPKLRLRIIKLSPPTLVDDYDAWKIGIINSIENRF